MTSPASSGRELNNQALQFLQNIINREPTDADADRAEADMRLAKAIHHALMPLTEEGFLITDISLGKSRDGTSRQVTLLHREEEQYFLACLPRDILRTSARVSERLIAFLDLVFPKESKVFFVCYNCDAIALGLQRIMEFYRNVTAIFIPWLWIRPDAEGRPQRVDQLLDAFSLEQQPRPNRLTSELTHWRSPSQLPVQPAASARRLSADQVNLVAANMDSHMAENGRNEYFDDLVRRLDLPPYLLPKALGTWGQDGQYASSRLIRWADHQGPRVLSRLLFLLIESGPGRPEAPGMLAIVQACGDPDQERIARLRDDLEALHG